MVILTLGNSLTCLSVCRENIFIRAGIVFLSNQKGQLLMNESSNAKQIALKKQQKALEEMRNKRNEQKILAYKAMLFKVKMAIACLGILFFISFFLKGSLVDYKKINADLYKQPLQTETDKKEITLNYMGVQYLIKPVQDYEISGLVVSHNNPSGFGDIYHDSKSFDTKDLCVIWGNNLINNDFHKVKFWNVSWTCNVRYPPGINFEFDEISNNHLITRSDEIRKKNAHVKVGDQIKIKGALANYTSLNNESGWRNSSLTRTDTGNGACEVIWVESLEILKKGTPLWYLLFDFSKWGLLLMVVMMIGIVVKSSKLQVSR